jgi:Na+-transporting NADH:ubiquinone oxidoreductase subunit NqrC
MRLPPDEYAIETPIVLLILIFMVASIIFFGVRYEMKVHAGTQAQAKREATYQAAVRSYSQVIKPGMKRKEIKDYLRNNKIEFRQVLLDDVTQIGQDESTTWFCEKSDVFVKFQFTAFAQLAGQPDVANERDTLDEIKIYRMPGACL